MASYLLTDRAIKEIETFVMNGATKEDAAGAIGVNRTTLWRWEHQGLQAIKARAAGAEPDEADDLFVKLADTLEISRFKAKVEAIQQIRKAMLGHDVTEVIEEEVWDEKKDGGPGLVVVKRRTKTTTKFEWAAAMTWLERMFPGEFARLIRTEVSGPGGQPIPIEERISAVAEQAEAYLIAQSEAAESEAEEAAASEPGE